MTEPSEREKIAAWLEEKAEGWRRRARLARSLGSAEIAISAEEMATETAIYAHDIRNGAGE